VVTPNTNNLSKEAIQEMIEEAAKYEEEDRKFRERVEARNGLEGYAYSLKQQINDPDKLGKKLSAEDKQTMEVAVQETLDWMSKTPESEVTTEELREKKTELESVCNPIISKVYQAGDHGDTGAGDDSETVHEDL